MLEKKNPGFPPEKFPLLCLVEEGGLTPKSGPIFSKYKGEREGGMMGQTHQKYRALCFMKYLSEIC